MKASFIKEYVDSANEEWKDLGLEKRKFSLIKKHSVRYLLDVRFLRSHYHDYLLNNGMHCCIYFVSFFFLSVLSTYVFFVAHYCFFFMDVFCFLVTITGSILWPFFFSPWSIIIGSIELEGFLTALLCLDLLFFVLFVWFCQRYLEQQNWISIPARGWKEGDATSVYC